MQKLTSNPDDRMAFLQGASPWEILMEKEIPNCIKYQAWRRLLPVRIHI
jgi:hypothetical protein